jgi:hypothetical protein
MVRHDDDRRAQMFRRAMVSGFPGPKNRARSLLVNRSRFAVNQFIDR